MNDDSLVLGIETSCDETAAAVIRGGREILGSVVASQIDLHRAYGGVVPEVASRQHLLSIVPVVEKAMKEAGVGWDDLAGVAVTYGPGPGRLAAGGRQHGQGAVPGPGPAADRRQPPGGPHLRQLGRRPAQQAAGAPCRPWTFR